MAKGGKKRTIGEFRFTISAFLAEAKRLRALADRLTHEFLQFCLRAEGEDFWRGTGDDFPTFLVKNFVVATKSEYVQYRNGVERLGAEAPKVSVGAVRAIGSRRMGKNDAAKFYNEMVAWEDVNGGPIPFESAVKIVRDVCSRTKVKAKTGGASPAAKEVSRLREENEALKVENMALRSEIQKLRSQLRQCKRARKAA